MALQIHDHSHSHSHSHIIIGVVVLLPQITPSQTAKSNKCEVGVVEIWEDHNLFWSKLGDVHHALGWLSKKPTRRFQVLSLKTDKASIIVDCNKTLQVFIYNFLIETEGDLTVFKSVI